MGCCQSGPVVTEQIRVSLRMSAVDDDHMGGKGELESIVEKMLRTNGKGIKGTLESRRFADSGGAGGWEGLVRSEASAWWLSLHGNLPKDQAYDAALAACISILPCWPRGDGPGCLLNSPAVDNTPVHKRGVADAWCEAALAFLSADTQGKYVPTRLFVGVLAKLLTARAGCALYFYLPREFRSECRRDARTRARPPALLPRCCFLVWPAERCPPRAAQAGCLLQPRVGRCARLDPRVPRPLERRVRTATLAPCGSCG